MVMLAKPTGVAVRYGAWWTRTTGARRRKVYSLLQLPLCERAEMTLAGLEPAISWLRARRLDLTGPQGQTGCPGIEPGWEGLEPSLIPDRNPQNKTKHL